MDSREKGKMFLKHCQKHPIDVLRLGKVTVLYGVKTCEEGMGKARGQKKKEKIWRVEYFWR